jgi:hypothetical protein
LTERSEKQQLLLSAERIEISNQLHQQKELKTVIKSSSAEKIKKSNSCY